MASWRRVLLEPDPAVQLTLASSIWSDVGITLRPDVLADLRRSYDARAANLDFRDPSAIRTINEWVNRATVGAITDVVSYLDPEARLLLIGALHFRGRWTRAFNRESTKDEIFHLPGGQEFPQPMMKASDEFQHFKTDEMEGLALPYGGGRWRMLVFLPSGEAPWTEVMAGLNVDAWDRWSRRLRKDQGTIVLPRFRLESSLTLARVLNDLGLPMAVDVQLADFGGATIDTAPLTVGALLQRVFVEVDEEGTEAAAATLMVQVVAWPPPSWQPFQMQVDRPFLFGIEDTYSDSLLFLGAVNDPRPAAGSQPAGASFVPPPGTPPEIARLSSF
jgi:serpin B